MQFSRMNWIGLAVIAALSVIMLSGISVPRVNAAASVSAIDINPGNSGATCGESNVNVSFDISVDDSDGRGGIFMTLVDGFGRTLYTNFEFSLLPGQTYSVDQTLPFYSPPSGSFPGPGNNPLARPFTVLIVNDDPIDNSVEPLVVAEHTFDPAIYAPSCADLTSLGTSNVRYFGVLNGAVTEEHTLPPDTAAVYQINIATMPWKSDIQVRTGNMNHNSRLYNASGQLVNETKPHVPSMGNIIYNKNLPTGTYYLAVVPNTATAAGTYGIAWYVTTFPLMSLDWPTSAHSSTALGNTMEWYFTCDVRCDPGFVEYVLDDGNIVWEYTLLRRGGGVVASGQIDGSLVMIPFTATDGTYDFVMERVSGEGSYTLQVKSGTPPPTFQVVAQPQVVDAYIGDEFTVDLNVEGPGTAPEGGIKGLDMACEADPAIVQGVEIVDGTAFSSSAIGQALPEPDFTQGAAFRYLIAEGADEAIVTEDGKVITAAYTAMEPGTATLNCLVEGLDATLEMIPEVPYVGMTINVVGSGSIEGVVTLREANGANDGIEVGLSDADGNVVKTVVTDATGEFLFEDLRPEAFGGTSYTLTATAPGYLKATTTTTVSVEGDEVTTVATTELIAGEIIVDGIVDLLDIVQFAADFTEQEANPTPTHNFDRNNDVNLRDYALIVNNLDATDIDW